MHRKIPSLYRIPLIGLLFFCIMFYGPLMWVMIKNTDQELRTNLLLQSTIAASALDKNAIKELNGSPSDINLASYQTLKDRLASIRTADRHYRFLYLMGRKKEGGIYFYVDSELAGSEDYSPPGQIYQDYSPELNNSFDTGQAFVEGPVKDVWGTWVSAITPIVDPKSGKVMAVLGLDVDAQEWHDQVINKTLPSIGFATLLLACIVTWFFVSLRRTLSDET